MLITAMLSHFISVIVQAFALPIARSLGKGWTWLYTAVAPEAEREARRSEVLSDLFEHVENAMTEGYRPAEVGVQIVLRVVIGIKDDLAWFSPYLLNTIVAKLENVSEALRLMETPKEVTSYLAFFSMINLLFFFSDGQQSLMECLGLNVVALGVVVATRNRHHKWVRRVINWYLGVGMALTAALLVWIVIHYRLHQMPGFSFLLFQSAVTALPFVLMTIVSSESFRVRIFKNNWWPVFICWGLIAAISLGTAIFLELNTLVTVWAAIALFVLALVTLCAIFLVGANFICYVGLKSSSLGMRLISSGIRHLG